MKKTKHDVIVVGSGPVGSYTAYLLAKEGLDVGIFERNPYIGKDVNCTGIISVECLKKIHLPEEVILKSIDSIKAIAPSGNYLRYQAASPLAYVVDRTQFDCAMNGVATREGATTYLDAKVEEIDVTDNDFRIKLKTDGEVTEFSARAGVIATGFELHSLHRMFQMPKNFLFGIQTEVRTEDISDVEVYFGKQVAPGSFAWIVPTNRTAAKVGLIVRKNPGSYLKSFLQNPNVKDRLRICENTIRCSPIPVGRIPKSYAERLVVVGEAAGQVKATTGGGIYFGLIGAEMAAETILKAFRSGDYSERMFKEYELAWRERLEPELKAGTLLRSIYSRLTDAQIDFLMDLAKRDGVLPNIEKTHFDWHKDLISYLIRHLIKNNIFSK
jgi:digeranylgeranylglycerophospholipid reductase